MTWLTAFHIFLFFCSSGLWSPSPPVLCVFTSCFLYPSVPFKCVFYNIRLASHVCFGRFTCLLLWDGLLITHTLQQHRWCNCSQCRRAREMYKCQGTQFTVLSTVVWVFFYFLKRKNSSTALLVLSQIQTARPQTTQSPFTDRLTNLIWQALMWLADFMLLFWVHLQANVFACV